MRTSPRHERLARARANRRAIRTGDRVQILVSDRRHELATVIEILWLLPGVPQAYACRCSDGTVIDLLPADVAPARRGSLA